MLVQISWERTLPYLSTGISNLLQPAQAEAVLGQRCTYLASWIATNYSKTEIGHHPCGENIFCLNDGPINSSMHADKTWMILSIVPG